jgi:hypothetical protein
VLERRVRRVLRRRVAIGIPALVRDRAVLPVRPRVGGEEERCGERCELDRGRQRDDGSQRRAAREQQPQRKPVGGEGAGERGEEGDAPAVALTRATGIVGDEWGAACPGEADAGCDEDEGEPGGRQCEPARPGRDAQGVAVVTGGKG